MTFIEPHANRITVRLPIAIVENLPGLPNRVQQFLAPEAAPNLPGQPYTVRVSIVGDPEISVQVYAPELKPEQGLAALQEVERFVRTLALPQEGS